MKLSQYSKLTVVPGSASCFSSSSSPVQRCLVSRVILINNLELHPVATAIRDYQYLQDKQPLSKDLARTRKLRLHKYFYSGASFFDPWSSHYSYFQDQQHHRHGGAVDPLRQVLMRHLPSRLTFSRHERLARAKEYDDGLPPRDVSRFVDGLARFVVALAGGVFLVVPMVVMIIAPSETKSVVTVAVAVLVFALILSFGIKVSNVETLVSTATYAAVLVVFVGTSSEGNGGS